MPLQPAPKKEAQKQNQQNQPNKKQSKLRKFWSLLGPGLVTGAADDDPSGVVTYSQAGARFGLGQLWTAILMLPFLIAIQEMCARIGVVTTKGLTQNIKEHYPKWILFGAVGLLFLANTINIGADIGAMAASTQLFIHVPFIMISLVFFVLMVSLEIFVSYHRYAHILKWLTLTLLAYVVTGLIVSHDWRNLLIQTFLPHIQFNSTFFILLTGVIGTTISPYMFFWQAQQEVEEERDERAIAEGNTKSRKHSHFIRQRVVKKRVANMRIDTFFGMLFSEIGSWFIIVTTALVLNAHGITNIQTAQQAAQALRPLVNSFPHAGTIAELLFSVGIIGAGLLAVPIFAATSAYAIAEVFDWKEGLSERFSGAKAFYLIIAIGTMIGLLLNFIGVNPISALVYTAVLNGTIAPVLILLLIRMANNKKIMGDQVNGIWSNIFTWATFVGMAAAIILSIYKLVL
jgi:NRAMP (natural resistance-associated macrophage protein)-like metal ion transporter